MSPTIPTTRAEARRIGAKRYRTGEACANGHLADRYTSSGNCVLCRNRNYQRSGNVPRPYQTIAVTVGDPLDVADILKYVNEKNAAFEARKHVEIRRTRAGMDTGLGPESLTPRGVTFDELARDRERAAMAALVAAVPIPPTPPVPAVIPPPPAAFVGNPDDYEG